MKVFSSPELKAQVSILIKICPLSVVVVVVVVLVGVVVNFSHFNLLLQNHWANFKQTWHKASLGEGDSVCSNEGSAFFQGEIIKK